MKLTTGGPNLKCGNERVCDKLGPDFVLREEFVGAVVLHEASEALVQPEVSPPLHSDQVA